MPRESSQDWERGEEGLLKAELEYITQTAFQANEDMQYASINQPLSVSLHALLGLFKSNNYCQSTGKETIQ